MSGRRFLMGRDRDDFGINQACRPPLFFSNRDRNAGRNGISRGGDKWVRPGRIFSLFLINQTLMIILTSNYYKHMAQSPKGVFVPPI